MPERTFLLFWFVSIKVLFGRQAVVMLLSVDIERLRGSGNIVEID
jgi:hypothetical protein